MHKSTFVVIGIAVLVVMGGLLFIPSPASTGNVVLTDGTSLSLLSQYFPQSALTKFVFLDYISPHNDIFCDNNIPCSGSDESSCTSNDGCAWSPVNINCPEYDEGICTGYSPMCSPSYDGEGAFVSCDGGYVITGSCSGTYNHCGPIPCSEQPAEPGACPDTLHGWILTDHCDLITNCDDEPACVSNGYSFTCVPDEDDGGIDCELGLPASASDYVQCPADSCTIYQTLSSSCQVTGYECHDHTYSPPVCTTSTGKIVIASASPSSRGGSNRLLNNTPSDQSSPHAPLITSSFKEPVLNFTFDLSWTFDVRGDTIFVAYLYDKYLQRTPTSEEILYWTSLIRKSQHTTGYAHSSLYKSLTHIERSFWFASRAELADRNASMQVVNSSENASLLLPPVPLILNTAQTTCFDSDGGNNVFLAGTARAVGVDGRFNVHTDACYNEQILVEWSCEYNLSSSSSTPCLYGCVQGACIRAPSPTSVALSPFFSFSTASAPKSSGVTGAVISSSSSSFSCGAYQLLVPHSGTSTSGPSPVLAYDANASSTWYGEQDAFPKTLTFDLGETYCLQDIDLFFTYDDLPLTFAVATSVDGSVWQTSLSTRTTAVPRLVAEPFPMILPGRYVRVIFEQSSRPYGALAEIRLGGAPLVPA